MRSHKKEKILSFQSVFRKETMKVHLAKEKINGHQAHSEKWSIPSLSVRPPWVGDQNNPSLRILNIPNSKPHHPVTPLILIELILK
jgi:hypothetical protein